MRTLVNLIGVSEWMYEMVAVEKCDCAGVSPNPIFLAFRSFRLILLADCKATPASGPVKKRKVSQLDRGSSSADLATEGGVLPVRERRGE